MAGPRTLHGTGPDPVLLLLLVLVYPVQGPAQLLLSTFNRLIISLLVLSLTEKVDLVVDRGSLGPDYVVMQGGGHLPPAG